MVKNKKAIENKYLKVLGVGSCLGEVEITNTQLSKTVDTNDEWIVTRTGITKRYVSNKQHASKEIITLSKEASLKALKSAGISAKEIDVLIVATCTPGQNLPSVASQLQDELNIGGNCQAFDVAAACSGFILAMNVARGLSETHSDTKNYLIIGAEVLSSILNWSDRNTCVLFGDGAGAVVCSRTGKEPGLIDTYFRSDGKYKNLIHTDPELNYVKMDGSKVFVQAIKAMGDAITILLERNNLTSKDIDFLIPHQANQRIIESLGKRLKLPSERVISTVGLHANTSAASIPLALDHAVSKNRIKPGNLILATAFGSGITWGSSLFRWK